MLRIIAGSFKGRRLVSPGGRNTRPTADQVREAIFSMLESLPFEFQGAKVLDFFAGSGALAFEALSRGANSAVLADRDRASAEAVRQNLEALNLQERAVFIRANWPRGLAAVSSRGPFDLIFLDPPYENLSLPPKLLKDCSSLGLAAEGAVAVWEQDPKSLAAWGQADVLPWTIVKTRSWGRQAAAFLVHSGP